MSVFDQASPQRRRLGQELRALREAAGLSGMELARRTGISQSKVSRIEHAQQLPSAADLEAWAKATRTGATRRAELAELREQAATEQVTWRRELRRGLSEIQAEVKAVEAAATRIREYQPTIIPGLLQTPASARAAAEARYGPDDENVAKWVAGVANRQPLLYEEGRRFEFILGEAGLRWGRPEAMGGQLDRIGVIAGLPNVTVAILPLDRELSIWHSHPFIMFEQPDGQALVHLELLTGAQNLRDPDDVSRFAAAFERLLELAATGQEAEALLERIAQGLQ
jgi:transcriptional regulator with XRE-family HTH domain